MPNLADSRTQMAERLNMAALTWFTVALCAFLLEVSAAVPVGSSSPFRCQRSSPVLNNCVREGLERVLKHFKTGRTDLGVPPLEPLEVPYLEMKSDPGEGNLTLDVIMKNIRIRGLTDILLAKVRTNLDDVNKLEVTGKTPALLITGEYISEGLIVNFPLHSAGMFTVNMTEVTSSWVVYLQEQTRNKVQYLQIDSFDVEMMPVNIAFHPAAQLDGDNRLGEAVDIVLNENSHEIYSMIKGRLAAVLGDVLTELANTVLSQVPESVYLES